MGYLAIKHWKSRWGSARAHYYSFKTALEAKHRTKFGEYFSILCQTIFEALRENIDNVIKTQYIVSINNRTSYDNNNIPSELSVKSPISMASTPFCWRGAMEGSMTGGSDSELGDCTSMRWVPILTVFCFVLNCSILSNECVSLQPCWVHGHLIGGFFFLVYSSRKKRNTKKFYNI